MKKTYIVPVTTEENVLHKNSIMTISNPDISVDKTGEIDPSSVDVREDNAWDIWGSDEVEY